MAAAARRVLSDRPPTAGGPNPRAVAPPQAPPPPAPRPASSALFRQEALDDKRTQALGTILLEQRSIHALFARVSLVAVVLLLALLVFGSYTRKARVVGWLVPQQGLARVFAPMVGTVTKIDARDGAEVTAGTPLLTLSGEIRSESLAATRGEIVGHLKARRESLTAARLAQVRLNEQQTADIARRVASLEEEERHLVKEIALQAERVKLGKSILSRESEMRDRGLVPLPRLQRAQQEQLDQAARLQTLERTRSVLERDLVAARGQAREQPLRGQTLLGEIDRNIAAVEQELAEAEVRRRVVITAPQDGVVTSLQVELGGTVATNVPLLTVVPKDAVLEAHLFAPSRAIGFVRPGQKVLLRLQPFPYQKFGFHEGVVTAVSRSATSPSELPPQLAGAAGQGASAEPLYRLSVAIARQDVMAYGKPVALQPGMQAEADVMIESRRLIEWLFDPLYSIAGR